MQMILRRMLDKVGNGSEEALMMEMLSQEASNVSTKTLQMATTIVTIIPIICVYPFIQKYFVKGIMVGSLKG